MIECNGFFFSKLARDVVTIASLTSDEREVIRHTLQATLRYFDFDFHSRIGVNPETMHALIAAWPNIDDTNDDSDACLAINNALNDLLHGEGIAEREALGLVGVSRAEMERIYKKWAAARGWKATGIR